MLAVGAMKATRPRPALKTAGMEWVEDYSDGAVKTIGTLEILAALGLVLPAALDLAPWLVPTAATGVIFVMVGPPSPTSDAANRGPSPSTPCCSPSPRSSHGAASVPTRSGHKPMTSPDGVV